MGLFRKLRSNFHDDWCSQCTSQMDEVRRRLYALPTASVGHYVSHTEPEFLKEHLVPVRKKADIPTGMYACGLIAYRCPQCGHRAVKASIFLPVRDMENYQDGAYFENGELDDFLWSTEVPVEGPNLGRPQGSVEMGSVINCPRHTTEE